MIDVVAFQHIPFYIIFNEENSDISSTINMFDFNYNRLMADVNAIASFDYIYNNKCNTLISTFMSCHVMSCPSRMSTRCRWTSPNSNSCKFMLLMIDHFFCIRNSVWS